MKRKMKQNAAVIVLSFLLLCTFSVARAESLVFSQLDFNLDEKLYQDTEWGSVDFTFTGQGPIMYFNLAVNGSWQVQNIPVLSVDGEGVEQTMTFDFDLGSERGTDVAVLEYDYAFTSDILASMPGGSTAISVSDKEIVMSAGVNGLGGNMPKPAKAKPLVGARVASNLKHAHKNFPNQECKKNECTPTAVSNSLHFLNEQHKLDMDADDISIAKMKTATGWDDGCDETWWKKKNDYMKNNNLPITTKKIQPKDIGKLADEMDDKQDIEIDESWKDPDTKENRGHTTALIGIVKLKNGKYTINVADDRAQGKPGGVNNPRTYTYDPATGEFFEAGWGFTKFDYAIVECPKDPNAPNDPSPASGDTVVPATSGLGWSAPSGGAGMVVGYDVYMDPNEARVASRSGSCAWVSMGQMETTYDPTAHSPLAYEATYYWCVDVTVMPGSRILSGAVWDFTIIPEVMITGQPLDTSAFSGDTAELTIEASSDMPLHYVWYLTMDNANDTPGDDVPLGPDSDTLVFPGVSLADEGYYYCEVFADGGFDVARSEVAKLGVKRLVAHWPFDGDYSDISGEGHDAVPEGTGAFVAGMAGLAAQIDPNNGWASVDTWDPSHFTRQLSVSMWVKPDGASGDGQGLISKRNAWAVDEMMWQLEIAQDTGTVQFVSTSDTISSPAVPSGQWVHVAVSFDGQTAAVYQNGVRVGSDVFEFDFKTDANLTIGARQRDELGNVDGVFDGFVDEMRVYNYVLTKYDVADLYYQDTGQEVCVDRPLYDFSGDCEVSLADLSIFAADWLDSGLHPGTP